MSCNQILLLAGGRWLLEPDRGGTVVVLVDVGPVSHPGVARGAMPLVREPRFGAAAEVGVPVAVIVATAVAVAGEGRDHRSALRHVDVPGVRLPPVRRLVRVAPGHPKTLAQVVLDVRFAVAFAVGRLDGCHRVFRDLHLLNAVRILPTDHVGTLTARTVKPLCDATARCRGALRLGC